MKRTILHAKIHRAVVTQADLNYVGSITIDADLLEATGIVQNQLVMIADITNGARLETYVIRGEAGSGVIGMNGAAAHLINVGDQIIIMAYAEVDDKELSDIVAKVAVVDEENRIEQMIDYPCLPSLTTAL